MYEKSWIKYIKVTQHNWRIYGYNAVIGRYYLRWLVMGPKNPDLPFSLLLPLTPCEPPPPTPEMQLNLKALALKTIYLVKLEVSLGREPADESNLLTPPFALDLRRTSTLKSPSSSTRAIPLAMVQAFARSQQCVEIVTVPSFPIFTLCKQKKNKSTSKERNKENHLKQ